MVNDIDDRGIIRVIGYAKSGPQIVKLLPDVLFGKTENGFISSEIICYRLGAL